MDNVKVLDGQSLFDIALQRCGGIQAVFELADMNGLSITDQLEAGSEMEVPEATNREVLSYYTAKGIRPATDATTSAMDSLRDEGIDFWAIAVDFVVQ